MKVKSELIKKIKNMDGKIIGIGIADQKILDTISKNNKILFCDLLNDKTKGSEEGKKRSKIIYINKLRKRYKHKKINYIVCDVNEVDKYLKTFVRDSVYINNNDIYLYMDKQYDVDKVISKYERYTKKIEQIKCDDGIIIKINTNKVKNNFIKDKIYYLIDLLNMIGDFIGDFLIN